MVNRRSGVSPAKPLSLVTEAELPDMVAGRLGQQPADHRRTEVGSTGKVCHLCDDRDRLVDLGCGRDLAH